MSFDETIVKCSAPALCGIKPASLFSMSDECFRSGKNDFMKWRREFSQNGRYFVPLKKDDGRILFFVFDRNLLLHVLEDGENRAYLSKKGYPTEKGFSAILAELLHRLLFCADFPHEVGLFLGYPLADVLGFERREVCEFSGFWKVYANREEAQRRMNLYKSCSETCRKLVGEGFSVPSSIKKYIQKGV